jgi:hypothetical protein
MLIPPSVIRECTGVDLARTTIALTAVDFEVALLKARASYSESIGAPKIPDVSWDDVGGLAHVKSDILDTIQLPLDHPELFADGLKKRSGIYLSTQCVFGLTFVDKGFFFMDHPGLAKLWLRKRWRHLALSTSFLSRVPSFSICTLGSPKQMSEEYFNALEMLNLV